MRKEIKELFANYKVSISENKTLNDYGNEQIYTIKFDLPIDDLFYEHVKKLKSFAEEVKEQCAGELSMGDHVVTLEAAFETNNHFIFIISALK